MNECFCISMPFGTWQVSYGKWISIWWNKKHAIIRPVIVGMWRGWHVALSGLSIHLKTESLDWICKLILTLKLSYSWLLLSTYYLLTKLELQFSRWFKKHFSREAAHKKNTPAYCMSCFLLCCYLYVMYQGVSLHFMNW